jgi:hypothetical protein
MRLFKKDFTSQSAFSKAGRCGANLWQLLRANRVLLSSRRLRLNLFAPLAELL